ncbi:hypothetical protein L6452_06250 [Arctium lappa]|uniref:Uncharacterized protein n=1 Tax=Arctium lappa TaxID=4217 RepID=A0ACB9EI63_ARCLA|nr:hypothetical protein L6452_06250 [Arctium lappa]
MSTIDKQSQWRKHIINKDLEHIVLIPHIIDTSVKAETISDTSTKIETETIVKDGSSEIIVTCPIIVDGNEKSQFLNKSVIEAECDKLKNQNSKLLKQIQELKLNVSNSDKTPVCAKCTDIAKSDFAETEQKASEHQAESVELQSKFKAFEDKISALETQNAELTKSIQADKDRSIMETSITQQISDFSKKTLQEKKDLELRCLKFSKQVSKFEKIVITERDTFVKEIQVLENKITELPKQVSTLQDLLEKERQFFKENKKSFELEKKNYEKRNVGIFKEISEKTKNLEKYFEQERLYFESEISKLTSRITILSSDIQKEQKDKSDLKQKFDTLSDERNILTKKINDLDVANIELSGKVTSDVISQSPVDNSTESVCSFKTASSSIHDKNVFKKKSVKPTIVKSSQIRASNLFYDKSIDGSANFYIKSLGKHSKKNQMVWRVKNSSDEEKKKDKASASTTNAKKNRAHKDKSFVYPDMFYSTNHLIRVAQKKICCSYCGAHDFFMIQLFRSKGANCQIIIKEEIVTLNTKGVIKYDDEIEDVLMIMVLTIIKKGEISTKINFKDKW